MKLSRAYKFQMREIAKSVVVFYLVFFACIFAFATLAVTTSDGHVSFGGFEVCTIIMMFVTMTSLIRSDFLLFLQHGYSRKTLFLSTSLGVASTAAVIITLETVVFGILGKVLPYQGMFAQTYAPLYENISAGKTFFDETLWKFILYILAASGGIFISLLYYRMNKLWKTIVSISVPGLIFVVYPVADTYLFDGALTKFFLKVVDFYTGFQFEHAIYVNTLCNVGIILLMGILSFLLLRRCNYKK